MARRSFYGTLSLSQNLLTRRIDSKIRSWTELIATVDDPDKVIPSVGFTLVSAICKVGWSEYYA